MTDKKRIDEAVKKEIAAAEAQPEPKRRRRAAVGERGSARGIRAASAAVAARKAVR